VIVDLAGESGGNTELTEGGETVTKEGVTIIAPRNLPSEMADDASALYAKNVQNLLELMVADDGSLKLDFEDEIIAGACLTHEGEIRNERAKQAVEGGGG
jgi:NAD(P) transhydrogenase subunit alpha